MSAQRGFGNGEMVDGMGKNGEGGWVDGYCIGAVCFEEGKPPPLARASYWICPSTLFIIPGYFLLSDPASFSLCFHILSRQMGVSILDPPYFPPFREPSIIQGQKTSFY